MYANHLFSALFEEIEDLGSFGNSNANVFLKRDSAIILN
jgi:hypothetical protein